jgi:hypothetical protein
MIEESTAVDAVALDQMPLYRRLLSSAYLKNNVLVVGLVYSMEQATTCSIP